MPGKLCGLLDSKSLDLSQIRFFVLDEADALAFGENYQMVSRNSISINQSINQ